MQLIRFILVITLAFGFTFAKHHKMFQSVDKKDAILLQKTKDKLWCPNCGMNLITFYKTSHAIKLKDGSFKQFCSMHCLVESLKKYKDKIVDILVVEAKTNKFINAKDSFYVVGSKIQGTMTKNSKYAFLSAVVFTSALRILLSEAAITEEIFASSPFLSEHTTNILAG